MSTKGFSGSFSVVDPEYYVCTVEGEYYRRPVTEYNIENDDYDKCDGSGSIKITGDNFKVFRDDNEFIGCSISKDEEFIFCYKNRRNQWRHSFYADYYIYDIVADQQVTTHDSQAKLKQAQWCGWSPVGHKLACVSQDKNIHLWTTPDCFTVDPVAVTDDGGWCLDEARIMDVVYTQENGKDKCIYNGVPEWNYEEEMIGGRSTIYWSPDASHFAFLAMDVSEIELLEYSVYPEHLASTSPDDVDQSTLDQYPRMNQYLYAKTAGKIAKTKMWMYNIEDADKYEINKVDQEGSLAFDQGIGCTGDNCDIEANQENRYLTQLVWSPDSSWFLSVWTSRDATQSKALACKVGVDKECAEAGREDGGVTGSWIESPGLGQVWDDDENSLGHGWVGSFGPFYPLLSNTFGEHFTIFSKKSGELEDNLHAYRMKIRDGYWNVVRQTNVGAGECTGPIQQCGAEWITDSVEEKWVVTNLDFYDSINDKVYFTAARGAVVGSHEATEQRKRHVFSVTGTGGTPRCVTCILDHDHDDDEDHDHHDDDNVCQWATIRRNCDPAMDPVGCPADKVFYTVRCAGPEYPHNYMTRDFTSWEIMEDNGQLRKSHDEVELKRTEVIFGVWYNEDYGTYHNYEMWVPADFDENTKTKKYPVFLEVYAGPEFQKVR